MEILYTVDGTIAHCVLAAFIPFHPVRPHKSLLYITVKATIYVTVEAY